ncbi:hypothetical protein EDB80DRAFT_692120 [Ilyonectria destructans]|nr:hypothetical protein EDB80DRAFT_692120 [Ilyonectria destructans]
MVPLFSWGEGGHGPRAQQVSAQVAYDNASATSEIVETHVEANVRVIQSMSKYWKFAALLDSYLRPMADMHSKNPFHPEDEPRSLQPFHLGGFGVALPRARTSVLTHTGILWKDDGFAVQGEKITESQLMENSEIRMQSPDGTSVNSGGEDHPGGF